MVTLTGEARIRLMLAMSRAHVAPFGDMEWGMWAGAMGNAHVVSFHPVDDDYLRQQLGITHWPRDYVVVILDEGGLTWNAWSPVNAYAWQVTVSLDVDCHEVGDYDEFWSDKPGATRLEQRIAQLPFEQRDLVMACPEEARPYVMQGLDAANTAAGYPPETQEPEPVLLYAKDPKTGEFVPLRVAPKPG